MTIQEYEEFASQLSAQLTKDQADQESLYQSLDMEVGMTLQDTEIEIETGEEVSTPLNIPVVKAKSTIKIMTDKLPEHVYREALTLGLKQLVNRGQTTLTKEGYPDPEKLKAASMEKAEATLENMYAGKIRMVGGAKSDKVPREIMTEARRIARNLVKAELKRAGVKVSYVESSEITKAANALLAADPDIIEQAKEEVEKQDRKKVKLDIAGMVPISQKKVKAAEAKKADKAISAKQAGKVATRARPQL
jgi:hypothetical protein